MAKNESSLELKSLPWKSDGLEVNTILLGLNRNNLPDTQDLVAIHNTMSDLSPSAALLYAAETMLEIANCDILLSFEPKFLKTECKKILDTYKTSSRDAYYVLEDLEEFNSLLDLCYLSYEVDFPLVSEIIDILRKQISAQIVIMDEVIDIKNTTQHKSMYSSSIDRELRDNVIPFPGCSFEN